MEERKFLLESLNETIAELVRVFHSDSLTNVLITEEWTAKDILGHITFWHESFARNVRDAAQGIRPTLLKGKLLDLNQRGVVEMRAKSVDEVLGRLVSAQTVIQQYVLNPELGSIAYRRGSRNYTPEEHLEMVDKHIQGHLKALLHQKHL